MKKCSTPIATKEMKVKMTPSFHVSPARVAVIKTANNPRMRQGKGKHSVDCNVN
jgi:hypothetical protein